MAHGATEDLTLSVSIRPPSRPSYADPGKKYTGPPSPPSPAPTPPQGPRSSFSRQQANTPQKVQEKTPAGTEKHTSAVTRPEHVLRRTGPRARQNYRGQKVVPNFRRPTQDVLPPFRSQRNSRRPSIQISRHLDILHPCLFLPFTRMGLV